MTMDELEIVKQVARELEEELNPWWRLPYPDRWNYERRLGRKLEPRDFMRRRQPDGERDE